MAHMSFETCTVERLGAELGRDHANVRATWWRLAEAVGFPSSWTKKVWRWEDLPNGVVVNLNRQNERHTLAYVSCDDRPGPMPHGGSFALSTRDRNNSRASSNLSDRIKHGPHVCFRLRGDEQDEMVKFTRTRLSLTRTVRRRS
jgi:hypothetical protein